MQPPEAPSAREPPIQHFEVSRWPSIYPERVCVVQERVKSSWAGLCAHGEGGKAY